MITVFVGNNGHGKTALLDAIRIALWSYVSNFDLARSAYADPANTISVSDVFMLKTYNAMMARQLPSEIEITGNYGDGLKTWKRFRDSEAPRSQTKDDVSTQAMKKYAEKLQASIRNVNDEPVDLPVLGYYGTGRLWKEKRLTQSKKRVI
ncbi:MAG: AAA family ATPase [Desulfamplus sp.]|nr:AAA family ATPase [Desulfamplus sp.]